MSYALSFVALFSPIAGFGLDSIVVRQLFNTPKLTQEILGTSFWIKIITGFCAFFLILVVIFGIDNSSSDIIYIAIIGLTLPLQALGIGELYFQAHVQSKKIARIQVAQNIASSIVKVLLVFFNAPLWMFVVSYLLDAILLVAGIVFITWRNKLLSFYKHFNFSLAKDLMKHALPLLFTGVAVGMYMRIDQVMLKEMLGDEAVGQFAAALKLSEAWYFIPIAVCTSLFPAILSAKTQSIEMYRKRLQNLYDLMTISSLLVAIPTSILAPQIIFFFYGSAYQEAAYVLQIHIWAAPFVFLGVAMSNWLIAEGLTLKSLYRTLFGLCVNILANLILIPSHGAPGAAMATLLGQFASNLLYDCFDKDIRWQLFLKLRSFFPIHLLRKG
jgi:O-antigen/teichoic acid export membrane protein